MEKEAKDKIKQCKQLIIQCIEKTIQHKMFYYFIKQNQYADQVKHFLVNGMDGFIKVQFINHQQARSFYDEFNFIGKILRRPFNIYFNISLRNEEIKKYYFKGITLQNIRSFFQECRKVGFCKIYTNYERQQKLILKPTGILTFARTNDIEQNQFKALSQNVAKLGIQLMVYKKSFSEQTKTFQQYIDDSKVIFIDGIQDNFEQKMLQQYLQDHHLSNKLQTYKLFKNAIKLQFASHEQAFLFYESANFIDKLINRTFNISFQLSLPTIYENKYFLSGIKQANLRKLFQICLKRGICRIMTYFTYGQHSCLKSTGTLIIYREQKFNKQEISSLTSNLKQIGITIDIFYDKNANTKYQC